MSEVKLSIFDVDAFIGQKRLEGYQVEVIERLGQNCICRIVNPQLQLNTYPAAK